MKLSPTLPLLCAFAAVALLGGCVRDRVVYVHDQPQPAPQEVVVTEAPPPPQVEVIEASPGPDYFWIGGCWEWHGRWIWTRGHYDRRPHAHAVWVPARHYVSGGRHVYVGGHWR